MKRAQDRTQPNDTIDNASAGTIEEAEYLPSPEPALFKPPEASGRSRPASARVDSVSLDIKTISAGRDTNLELSGALTAATHDRLLHAVDRVLERKAHQIVLDLSGVRTLDPAGAQALLICHLRASDQLADLRLVAVPPPVQRVIDATHAPFVYVDGEPDLGQEPSAGGQSRGDDHG